MHEISRSQDQGRQIPQRSFHKDTHLSREASSVSAMAKFERSFTGMPGLERWYENLSSSRFKRTTITHNIASAKSNQ